MARRRVAAGGLRCSAGGAVWQRRNSVHYLWYVFWLDVCGGFGSFHGTGAAPVLLPYQDILRFAGRTCMFVYDVCSLRFAA